jgi:hypothetical protein
MCAIAQDSSRSSIFRGAISSELTMWGKTGFSRSKLLQRGARSTPEHSSPDCEPLDPPPWKIRPERSSSGVLARWSKFLPGKSCSWRKSRAKAYTDWRHF